MTGLPRTLLGRIVLVMVIGVFSAQLLGNVILTGQIRSGARAERITAAQHMGRAAGSTLRHLAALTPAERARLINEVRLLGGARFLMQLNHGPIAVDPLTEEFRVQEVTGGVRRGLLEGPDPIPNVIVQFTWPDQLIVDEHGRTVESLAPDWVAASLMLSARPAPVLLIQAALGDGSWLLLAAPMPDPYFLDHAGPFTLSQVLAQLVTLGVVLLLAVLLVRSLIRPLDQITRAANTFGGTGLPDPVPETGTSELQRTARAFNGMLTRLQGYLVDRERLFIGISHGLKTPITRLKLRTELLDDDTTRDEFNEDLDELDVMVKSALQSMRDSDIHENLQPVRLDLILERLARRPILPNARITTELRALSAQGKPLALERALSNLLDNAILYGERAHVEMHLQAHRQGARVVVEIRDFGPGLARLRSPAAPQVPPEAATAPHPRISSGLGLGIARNIIEAHGGTLRLHNHAEGGLVVTLLLPGAEEE